MGWFWTLLFGMAALAWPHAAAAQPPTFEDLLPSSEARYVAGRALYMADAQGRPFAIVDKKEARIFVFMGNGRLAGATPVLIGATPGDHIVPGVGQRAQTSAVMTDERTTPAGRFETQAGTNLKGEHVVWVDYGSAFAIHRLRPGAARERREQRLASVSPRDNRVSLGCVVVPVAFYERVIAPVFGRTRGVVYVLPETRAARDLFSAM